MSPRILCYLPAERVSLCPLVFSAQAIPVVDLCASDRSRVPNGAWVRTRSKRDIPGKGPIILAGGNHRSPIRGRETWLEVTKPRKVPRGFAGIILRTSETGGWTSDSTWSDLLGEDKLQKLDPARTILDVGFTPVEWQTLSTEGFAGTVISNQLLPFTEFGLPPNLFQFLQQLDPSVFVHHNNLSVASFPLSNGLQKLTDGTDWWKVCDGWLREDSPSDILPPWGTSVLKTRLLATEYPSLESLLLAFTNPDRIEDAPPTVTEDNTLPVVDKAPHFTAVQTEPTIVSRTIVIPSERSPEPIAIVGMGCRLPKANSLGQLEQLLRQKTYAIQEVPSERWDPNLFWSANRKEADKTYSKIGGFIEEFVFEPKKFRIPPNVASQIDLVQQLTLMSVSDALADAEYDSAKTNPERVAVILGNSMGGEVSDDHTVRTRLPEITAHLQSGSTFQSLSEPVQQALLEDIDTVKEHLPTINEDTMPGELANVIAGRIANAFDFNGPNFTVDAACASSMAAIQSAVKGLREGEFDMAVTGGADRSMGVPTYVKFSKIGALSADISAPFDQRANGFVMGEGAAILILKRLSDAQRDGDRIYATIRSIGSSSDGKGKGITAPNPKGQRLALERAYQSAGIDISTVDYFECHGTSTQVGDKVEATVLADSITTEGHKPRLGSIKSNIGHLKSAAGAAAMMKGALSIYHKTFYGTANVEHPRTDLPLEKITIQQDTEQWESDKVRRVGVSAFGFGGTNFHVVLEENTPTTIQQRSAQTLPLPTEITCLSAQTPFQLEEYIEVWQNTQQLHYASSDTIRVIFSSASNEELQSQMERLLESLRKGKNPSQLIGRGIFYTDFARRQVNTQPMAFLFTGQGSQYLSMGKELSVRFDVVRQTFAEAEQIFHEETGTSLIDLINGQNGLSIEEQEAQLKDTRIAQPATLTIDIAIARLLRSFGVEADMVAGHSLGEYAACVVAGIMTFEEAIRAVSARGREMAAIVLEDVGKMASVAAGMTKIQPLLNQVDEYVIAANKNCPSQTVIAGSSIGVETMIELCKQAGIRCQELAVSHAFHSEIVAPAAYPLQRVLEGLNIQTPHLPISTNVTGEWYPESVPEIIQILSKQIASPVEWIQQIEGLHQNGCRIFVECGPKRALTGLTGTTLKGKSHVAIPTNHPRRGEALSFIDSLAHLLSLGVIESRASAPSPTAREQALAKEIADLRALLAKSSSPQQNTVSQPLVEVVCTGASLGLPGGSRVFSEDNIPSILRGDNRLSAISPKMKNLFLMKDIVRVQKNPDTGQGEFIEVNRTEDCIQWAGQAQAFDFIEEYSVDPQWAGSLDITSKLAIAAGLEALKDANIPLVEETRTTRSGLEQKIGWRLPKALQNDTGVIFASAFSGHTNFANHIVRDGDDGTGQFDRRFLFQVLAMAHAQFAQLIGAKGPNTHVNAACASTSQAIAIAEDWIRGNRAKRVIIIAADDVTNNTMLEWIGSGFLAVGAASTTASLEDAARPFDKSRNGMILGMGAVGMVLERQSDALDRGAEVIATLRGSRVSNAAYHGTRLDIEHIANEMKTLVHTVSKDSGLPLPQLAKETVFVSHETFTPARGGSAEAEIQGLRSAFEDSTPSVLITNTKGFTGHAMGAGIEDVVAIKALQHETVPPIPNLESPDDSALDLRFASGGTFKGKFAIRLAAGFGSQLVLLAWEKGQIKADLEKHRRWRNALLGTEPTSTTDTIVSTQEVPPLEVVPEPNIPTANDTDTVSSQILNAIALHTGYEIEDLELHYELEADLGIDTVKQAELFAELRQTFNIDEQQSFDLTTAPTIQSLIDWFAENKSNTQSTTIFVREETETDSVDTPQVEHTVTEPPFTPHLFRTQWVNVPVQQEAPLTTNTFRLVGNTVNDRHLIRSLEQNGLRHAPDGQIVIERSRNIEEAFLGAKNLVGQGIKYWICLLEVTTPNDRPAHIALKGGRSGLAKALAQEWTHCRSKVVWVNTKTPVKELGKLIQSELKSIDSLQEIYYEHQERYALTLQRETFPKEPHSTLRTMLFSGGGRGITAEVAKGFIRNGCKQVVLLGRTQPSENLLDLDVERIRIKEDLQKTGLKITPVMIEREVTRLQKANQIYTNILEMQRLGASVTFIQTDIANRESVDQAFKQIDEMGLTLDAVVHGAGTEESKPIEQKDIAAFRRVYHPKVQGALNLLENIPSSTFFLSMGSIAGRFGNQGQTDYAAANDSVAYICQQRNSSLHICWSAWADVGMASRGGMEHLLTSRGIDLLPVDFAVLQCVSLVEHRFLGEYIITGGLSTLPIPTTQPLLRSALLGSNGIQSQTRLHPNQHRWLNDHSLGDTPVLPGVIGLELMAQTISSIQNKKIVTLESILFDKPVKFHRNQGVDLIVETQSTSATSTTCSLFSVRQLAGGRTQRTLHFQAVLKTHREERHSLLAEGPNSECSVLADEIYRHFFHGPSFQVLESVTSMTSTESMTCGLLDHLSIMPTNILSPLSIESAFQAAGWHHWTQTQEMVLPKSVGSIQIFHQPTDWEGVTIRAQVIPDKPRCYNVDVYQNSTIAMTLRDLEFVVAPPVSNNNKDFWTPDPEVVIARSPDDLQVIPPTERQQFIRDLGDRGNRKRQQDRRIGRLALYKLLQKEGIQSPIDKTSAGKPILTAHDADISISHSNGFGWAGIYHKGYIGLDVEQIETRSAQFLQTWFRKSERSLCGKDPFLQTLVWSMKESLSKLIGTGFQVHPSLFEISAIDVETRHCIVRFHQSAATHFEKIDTGEPLRCQWIHMGNEVLTFVTLSYPKVRNVC